jgi:peptide/nickel transport system permease protein
MSTDPLTDLHAAAELAVAAPAAELRLARRETLAQLRRSPTFVAGIAVVVFWVVCAVFGTHLAPHDPLAQSSDLLSPPSSAHWFGTDGLGRDVFSRVIAGAQSVMTIAPIATALSLVVGTVLALVIGFHGGLVDEVAGRVIEASLAIPGIIITVFIVVAIGSSTWTIALVVAIGFTAIITRTIRVAVLGERNLDYVKAAQLRGASSPYIMFVEIFPNIVGPVIVEGTVRLGYAIFAIASLTFLGFGVQPPSPDWALQISENYSLLLGGSDWWTVLFPAAAIASLVVAINLVADSLAQVTGR